MVVNAALLMGLFILYQCCYEDVEAGIFCCLLFFFLRPNEK